MYPPCVVGIMRMFDKHVRSLSTGTIHPPTSVLNLLFPSTPPVPAAAVAVPLPFALQTAKSLLTCYTCVDHFLARREGEEQTTQARVELMSAAKEVETCWRALLAREDADEETRRAFEGKLASDLETIYSQCEDDPDFGPLEDQALSPDARWEDRDPFTGLPPLSHSPAEKLKFSYLSYKISPHLGRYLDQASLSSSHLGVPPLPSALLRFIRASEAKEALSSIALIQLFLCERVDVRSAEWAEVAKTDQACVRDSVAGVVMDLGKVMDEMYGEMGQGAAERTERRMLDKRRRWSTTLMGLCGKWDEVAKGMKVDCWSVRAERVQDSRREEVNINMLISYIIASWFTHLNALPLLPPFDQATAFYLDVLYPSLSFDTLNENDLRPHASLYRAPSRLLKRYSYQLRDLKEPGSAHSLGSGLALWFSATVDTLSPCYHFRLREKYILGSLIELYGYSVPYLPTSPRHSILTIFSQFLPPSSSSLEAGPSGMPSILLRPPSCKLRTRSLGSGRVLSVFFDALQKLSLPDVALDYYLYILSLPRALLKRTSLTGNVLSAFLECRGRTGGDPLKTASALASLQSPGLGFESSVSKEHVALLLHDARMYRGRSAVEKVLAILEGGGLREEVLIEGEELFSKTDNAAHVWMRYNEGRRQREKQVLREEVAARELALLSTREATRRALERRAGRAARRRA